MSSVDVNYTSPCQKFILKYQELEKSMVSRPAKEIFEETKKTLMKDGILFSNKRWSETREENVGKRDKKQYNKYDEEGKRVAVEGRRRVDVSELIKDDN